MFDFAVRLSVRIATVILTKATLVASIKSRRVTVIFPLMSTLLDCSSLLQCLLIKFILHFW